MSPDSLTLAHFLDRCRVVVDKADDLKALYLRAQGEIQIREALQEIETWATDAARRPPPGTGTAFGLWCRVVV